VTLVSDAGHTARSVGLAAERASLRELMARGHSSTRTALIYPQRRV